MKHLCSLENTPAYFAAANSFNGFRSKFKTIFAPEEYIRIFILKGGPGTGKSTLMKSIGEHFLNEKYDVTRFFCSSDPSSLDGVVISRNDKKVAIIDGTSPHMTDPEYPGLCEKIINLGDALNFKELEKRKKEIIRLNKEKKANYKTAYEYLAAAGEIHTHIQNIIENSDVYCEAEEICSKVLSYELFKKTNDYPTSFNYLCAFCKNGYVKLNIPCIEKEYISLIGDGFTEQTVMRLLRKKLLLEKSVVNIADSPLTENNTDAIITESSIISTDNVGNIVFDTTPLSVHFSNEYPMMIEMYKKMLSISQSYFSVAAEKHASLERIYSANINFEYNETCIKNIKSEIKEIL